MTTADPVDRQIAAVVDHLRADLGDELVGAWLYGSAVVGGLQARSDIDLLVLAGSRLAPDAKRRCAAALLGISVPLSRPAPDRPGGRPLEVTIVADPEVHPWRSDARLELQYGEWLRATFEAGEVEPPDGGASPDLAMLIEAVRRDGRTIVGPPARVAFEPIPGRDLAAGMLGSLDALLADLEPDTANVLLTLVRMWFTLETGEIAPKDLAAEWGMARLAPEDRAVLDRARAAYLGEDADWRSLDMSRIRRVAGRLAGQVRRAGEDAIAADASTL
ncbi:MAG TPA: aminoglycoside adenylyltransferase family protein [Candidatus Limnocylindrales bacterium]|nr:aminoglycoside adenylyltransferase family protein [Candidatus Limnocylindrales bacterium]